MQLAQLNAVYERLVAAFGLPVLVPDHDPLGGMVETILSQSTSDINSQRAYRDLLAAVPTWEAVRDAPTTTIAAAIVHGGLANIKAQRIQAALRKVTAILPTTADGTSLAERFSVWLVTMPVAEARLALQKIPSVGPKTAACVLLFSLGQPSMPVDTHVYRITQRLGWIDSKTSVARTHELYDAVTPAEMVYPLHILLITLGRRVCRARNPRCAQCPLRKICPVGQGHQREGLKPPR